MGGCSTQHLPKTTWNRNRSEGGLGWPKKDPSSPCAIADSGGAISDHSRHRHDGIRTDQDRRL